MSKVKLKIYTLGCKVNQYDSNSLIARLGSGIKHVNKDASFAIINSCAVTEKAIAKSNRMINLASKENPSAKIILTGCWPRVKEKISTKADFIISEKNQEKLVENISEIISAIPKNFCKNITGTDRARYFLKIQDGCEQFCSYCIIPFARGKLASRSKNVILKEFKMALEAGFSEIVLTGIHLGLFGKESHNKDETSLFELIKELIQIEGNFRIRLSSIEPNEVTEDLIKLIAEEEKLCKHLHIPLQAGDDYVLKRMNRPYDTGMFRRKIDEIRKSIPDIAISTDVIVGFPGEGEKEFENTSLFIREIDFSRLHVFSFSPHPGTKAFDLDGKVPEKEIKKRSERLRNLGKKLEKDFYEKINRLEADLMIIIENIEKDFIIGKTEYYTDLKIRKTQLNHANIGKLKEKELLKVSLK